jgi:WD40 repeat protein/tRNA A-37 threonylcarbamoyl transferase component Bud32
LGFAGLTEFMAGWVGSSGGDLGPGSTLGDVTIVRLIDEGGMGRVYEGLQGMPCRTVAVKVIRPGVLSPTAAKRFQHEAQILGRLTHPGICRIYSVGMERLPGGEVPYFVMEYIENALTITGYATQRSLSIRDRVMLFCEACRAVAHGHQKGIIHRDLKPGNILVDSEGRPKIIDFGVARNTDGDTALTTMHTDIGQLVGTLSYMAPEQFDGAADGLDVRADVYALGVVLYELLAGSLPYDIAKRPVYEVSRVVKEVEPRSLSFFNASLRGDLDTIVAKCLQKESDKRYSSAAELEADLSRHLRGEPISASPPRLLEAVARLARRHRLAALAATGVLASLVLAIAGIAVFAVRAERQRKVAVTAQEAAVREAREAATQRDAAAREKARADAEADLARQRLYVANLRALDSSLDQKNLRMAIPLFEENAAIQGRPLPLEMQCVEARLDDAVAVLDPGAGPISRITYSPDASQLAVIATGPWPRRLMPRKLADNLGANANEPIVFTAGRDGRLDRSTEAEAEGAVLRWGPWWSRESSFYRRPGNIRGRLKNTVEALAVSLDGLRMAMHTPNGGVCIIDRATGDDEAVLDGLRGRLEAADFDATGTRLVTLKDDLAAMLWDAESGRLIARCGGADCPCEDFVFSPDGSRLAAVSRTSAEIREVFIYDTVDGRLCCSVTTTPRQEWGEAIMLFTPDGGRLITSCNANELFVWNVADGGLLARLPGHDSNVIAAAISPDGRRIASGTVGGHIHVWCADSYTCERTLIGHTAAVSSLAFRDDETLASGSLDGTVRFWSSTAAEPLAVLSDIRGMSAAVFRPDGRQLAVAPRDQGGIQIWDPRTVQRIHTLIDTSDTAKQIAYSPDGSLVAAAFQSPRQDGDVCVWQADSGKLLWTFRGHAEGAVAVAFSSDGTRLLTTSGNGMVMVWDVRTGRRQMARHSGFRSVIVRSVAVFGLGGSRVACSTHELLDSDTGNAVTTLRLLGQVTCLAASPDGRKLATGVAMGAVHLNDFTTGNRLASFIGHNGFVRAIAFSSDGGRLLTGTQDGTVRLWDARRDGEIADDIHLFRGHEGAVESVAFTPDGRRIITAATDGTVRIWDAVGGRELLALPGQRDYPKACAMSPDGTRLVTALDDGSPRIWGLSNAEIFRARQSLTAGNQPEESLRSHDGAVDLGKDRRPHGVAGLVEAAEKRGEVGEVLPVETERLQVR